MRRKFNAARRCSLACSAFFLSLGLALSLAGCGGSTSSSDAVSTPSADVPAVITQTNSGHIASDYILTLLPSGSATYNQSNILTTGSTLTGTVPAALTTQFFKDLTAAMPLQNLPAYTAGGSALSTNVSVQYQGQTGPVDNPANAHEQALETDVVAIANALGLPTS